MIYDIFSPMQYPTYALAVCSNPWVRDHAPMNCPYSALNKNVANHMMFQGEINK